jgi:hypothetical protein
VGFGSDRPERLEIAVYLSNDGASVTQCSRHVELAGTLLTLFSNVGEELLHTDIAPLVEKFKQLKLKR